MNLGIRDAVVSGVCVFAAVTLGFVLGYRTGYEDSQHSVITGNVVGSFDEHVESNTESLALYDYTWGRSGTSCKRSHQWEGVEIDGTN